VDIPLDVSDRAVFVPGDIELNLTGFETGIRTIGRWMRDEALVLIETTVPIGTLEKVVKPLLLEERINRQILSPLYLAHAYERVMPGPHYIDSIRRFWRSYSGIDQKSMDKAKAFLETIIDTDNFPVWELNDPKHSELAKLLENSYRSVNIALFMNGPF
jgi:UDP-N-acetyl-D-mannosaminuronate dehydrogenase